LLILPQ